MKTIGFITEKVIAARQRIKAIRALFGDIEKITVCGWFEDKDGETLFADSIALKVIAVGMKDTLTVEIDGKEEKVKEIAGREMTFKVQIKNVNNVWMND